jgi:hypothetical protein
VSGEAAVAAGALAEDEEVSGVAAGCDVVPVGCPGFAAAAPGAGEAASGAFAGGSVVGVGASTVFAVDGLFKLDHKDDNPSCRQRKYPKPNARARAIKIRKTFPVAPLGSSSSSSR